ncbi:MAG: type II toxin-antitoxin system VapC family toxin, partial [Verrucomicrobiae bacterium]|nr:type II toxin-antitoxin system VapC family toxin [Verrucomicrobiae bacterium]
MSYLTAKPSRNPGIASHQQVTRKLWPKFGTEYQGFISALVYQEASRGNPEQAQLRLAAIAGFPMLAVDDDTRALAEIILRKHGIPTKYPEDALHVAVAARHRMNVLLTWNFAHLNNPFTRVKIRQ